MATDENAASDDVFSPGNDLQFTVLTQIIQVTATMRHIDEFLLWFTRMLTTSRFGIQTAQIWAMQLSSTGRALPQLRSVASQDTTLAENIIVNTNVSAVMARSLSDRRSSPCQPMDAIFSPHVSLLLKRHGLHYAASYFLSDAVLLPPPMTGSFVSQSPTPLALSLLLFLRQSPRSDVLPTVHSLLKQALPIVGSRGLLYSAFQDPLSPSSSHYPVTRPGYMLFELVPHRIEDMTSSPFGSPTLANMRVRQLLASINGRRKLAELCKLLQLEMKDILPMLQTLVKQRRIQICGPGGKPIDISLWLN
jgi:hypothetical protein